MTNSKIKKIAKWLVDTGYKNTMSGNYHITFEEVANQFNIPVDEVISHKEEIAYCVDMDKKILSETWFDEDFDMNFCGDFE